MERKKVFSFLSKHNWSWRKSYFPGRQVLIRDSVLEGVKTNFLRKYNLRDLFLLKTQIKTCNLSLKYKIRTEIKTLFVIWRYSPMRLYIYCKIFVKSYWTINYYLLLTEIILKICSVIFFYFILEFPNKHVVYDIYIINLKKILKLSLV